MGFRELSLLACMKKGIFLCLLVGSSIFAQAQNVRKSTASGSATSPFVWDCICIPLPGDSIIISHTITLNTDFAYLTGAVWIQPSGSLIGDSPNRIFAATDFFLNEGTFDVARVAFNAGSVKNTGIMNCDSLYNGIPVSPGFQQTGTMHIATSFLNSGYFTNPGVLFVDHNLYNGDTMGQGVVARFFNDGQTKVGLDFANGDSLSGSGKICIEQNTFNAGYISGTLDFCDLSGGGIDLNLGVVENTVTFCTSSCNVAVEGVLQPHIQMVPNPAADVVSITLPVRAAVRVVNAMGQQVAAWEAFPQVPFTWNSTSFANGIYLVEWVGESGKGTAKLLIRHP